MLLPVVSDVLLVASTAEDSDGTPICLSATEKSAAKARKLRSKKKGARQAAEQQRQRKKEKKRLQVQSPQSLASSQGGDNNLFGGGIDSDRKPNLGANEKDEAELAALAAVAKANVSQVPLWMISIAAADRLLAAQAHVVGESSQSPSCPLSWK